MNLTPTHWLRDVVWMPLQGGNAMNVRRCVVIHFTSGASAASSIRYWGTPAAKGASAHIVIDRDGTIYQCRSFNRTCGHAGVSRWRDPNSRKVFSGLNSCSIGIELANAGSDAELAKGWTKLPLIRAHHRNGGSLADWEAYPEAQLKSCFDLTAFLVERYNLDDVTGHDCIAPERKNDPGPAFPMEALRKKCGMSGLPEVFRP